MDVVLVFVSLFSSPPFSSPRKIAALHGHYYYMLLHINDIITYYIILLHPPNWSKGCFLSKELIFTRLNVYSSTESTHVDVHR